ncbi:MAG: MFS transporter [Proteobacteria bacterium]|jgi:MFS family permease|nr:MFS transporter [Pseudomonadota bacterium]
MGTVSFVKNNIRWLFAGFLMFFISSFGQTMFISIFSGEIQNTFNLTNGGWGGIYMLGTLSSAFVMLWVGGLTDTLRVRVLGSVTLSILAISCILMYFVQSVYLLTFVIFALRLSGQGMTTHIASVSMARWFVKTRGKAISISSLGYSLGEAALPVSFVGIIAVFGWRSSWLISSLITLITIPLLILLLKKERSPKNVSEDYQSFGMGNRHWTRKDALRHPLFWLLLPSLVGHAAFATAFFFLHVHIADVRGWSHIQIVSLFPIFTGFSISAMLISGAIIDRVNTRLLMSFCMIPSAIGFLIFSLSENIMAATIGIAFMAFSSGIVGTLSSAFWAEFYGTKHLGAIKALATSSMVLGSAIGPGLVGFIIDLGVNFTTQMPWISLYFILAAASAYFGINLSRKTGSLFS